MEAKDKTTTLSSVKKIIFIAAIFMVAVILIAQIYQDSQRKQAQSDAKHILIYQQQAIAITDVMSTLSFRRIDNHIAVDYFTQELLKIIKKVIYTQQEIAIQPISNNTEIARYEKSVSEHIDKILLMANDIMVSAELDQLTKPMIATFYMQSLPEYIKYKNKNRRLVDKLSAEHQKKSESNDTLLWIIVWFIMALVIIAYIILYKYTSRLISTDNALIEQEIQLHADSESSALEHANVMHDQQIKARSILDTTVGSIITITRDGKIDSFNKTAEQMFGYSAAEVIGQNVTILMPEQYAQEHNDYLRYYKDTAVQKSIGIDREVLAQRKDKSQFPMYLSVSEILESKPKLFTGILHGMTAWKKSEDELKQTLAALHDKQSQLENEEQVARHVFESITATNNDYLPELSAWCESMGTFSGDLMLSTVLPSGSMRVVLCDFTCHGLSAALGAIPVASVHQAMAQKSLPLEVVMEELNNKLYALLPTSIFCCITGIDLDATRTHAHIWNAGLPEVLVVDKKGKIKYRLKSEHLPLSVMKYTASEMHCVNVSLSAGDSIYLYSDGVTEAENLTGEMFGQQRFEALLTVAAEDGDRMNVIQNTMKEFINNAPASDDLSLLQIKTLVIADEIILES